MLNVQLRIRRLALNPPDAQHPATRAGAVRTAAEEVRAAGQRLLEEPPVFESFAENDPQHAAMARMGHFVQARAPAIDR